MHDYAIRHARVSLSGRSGVTWTEQPGFLVATIGERIAVRYKKFDDELHTCGIPTTQRRLWNTQEPLPGFQDVLHTVAGYTLDELGQIETVGVTCSIGTRVLWHIPAPESTSGDLIAMEHDRPGVVIRSDAAARRDQSSS